MGFTKRQKVALIISLWLYFLWIFAICSIMRAEYKGRLIGCIIIGGIGCVIVLALYIIVFADKYIVSRRLKQIENIKSVKSIRRTSYIWAIYIDIVGFFILSLSVLLVDYNKIHSFRLAWFIIAVAAFLIALATLAICSYRKVTSAVRTFSLQEKNDEIRRLELCADKTE